MFDWPSSWVGAAYSRKLVITGSIAKNRCFTIELKTEHRGEPKLASVPGNNDKGRWKTIGLCSLMWEAVQNLPVHCVACPEKRRTKNEERRTCNASIQLDCIALSCFALPVIPPSAELFPLLLQKCALGKTQFVGAIEMMLVFWIAFQHH